MPDKTATGNRIQQQVLAQLNLQVQAPMLHATIYGIGAYGNDVVEDADFVPLHTDGRLCEHNPHCEKCYA